MRNWLPMGGAGALIGYAVVYFSLIGNPLRQPEEQRPQTTAEPAEPIALSQVVEVTDTDPLLDPLPGQPAGVPFDPADPLDAPANAKPNSATPPAQIPLVE